MTINNSAFYNIEAEKAVLGALLLNNNLFDDINEVIKSNYFYVESHQHIFKLCETMIEKGQLAEAITISQLVALDSKYKKLITYEYLIELSSNIINFSSVKDYALIIKDLHLKRELVALTNSINSSLINHETAEEAISDAEKALYSLAETSMFTSEFKDFGGSLQEALISAEHARANNDGISGVATHFRDVDNKLGGLQKSDLIILAGRPSMGKTAFATNIAYNAAARNENSGVLIFSLEMSAEQLAGRILAQETRIQSDKIRKGFITDSEFSKLASAVTTLKNTPIFIDDNPNVTIGELRTKCRKFKRKNNLSLIVIDYIQLMSSNRKTDNRVLEISEITRGLKAIAKELNVPILALSQLSRAVESREDKKPMLADLRESGSIEQDADIVAFIYREEYYLGREEPIVAPDKDKTTDPKWDAWHTKFKSAQNLATLILAKNRHGPIGNIDLMFNADFTVFGNLDKHHERY
ncbi:replicative DNA helicase [Rickettsiales bacterium LUAb2]